MKKMNQQLKEAIDVYIDGSETLFTQLASDLGVALPVNANDWASLDIEGSGVSSSGIKYRKHGYGVSMRLEELSVDFDLGNKGELNGVDPWKLFFFAENNGVPLPYASTEEIQDEFKLLQKAGELVYSVYILYYLAEST